MPKIERFFQNYWLLMVFMSFKLILQFMVVNPVYELHRDEFLHLDQARHLAAGYISVPPFSSWISAIIFFLGGSTFWIRFFPALFGALTLLFAWLTVEELGGKMYAKILVSCAFLFSVFVRLNILYQPNAFDVLAWTGIFYFLIRYIRSEENKWLFYLMLAFVLGFYNKYTIAILLPGLLFSLIITKNRKIFYNRYFYISLLTGLVLILPNLYWQLSHHFPFVHHMVALKRTQLDHTSTSGFLVEQLMFMGGSLPLYILALIGLFFYRKFENYRIIGINYFTVLLIFIVLKAKSYYALGLYPVLPVFGAVYLESVLPKFRKLFVFALLIVANVIAFLFIYDLVLPVKSPTAIVSNKDKYEKLGLLKWNDGKDHQLPQDFADMQGWKEMAEKALLAYEMIPTEEREQTLIFCDNYGQAGALNYYNRHKTPEAYAANTDYIFWIPRMKVIKNVVLIGNKPDDHILAMFKSYQLTGIVENEFAIEKNTGIYLLRSANEDFTSKFYQTIDKRIREFDIF